MKIRRRAIESVSPNVRKELIKIRGELEYRLNGVSKAWDEISDIQDEIERRMGILAEAWDEVDDILSSER